jgi:methyl-CpG-binding domain protein 4
LVPHSSLNFKYYTLCLLLQVRKKLDGFFKRYPDAQTACTADPEEMAAYLAPMGLQHSKRNRIQKMSKAYVEEEYTYITELFGVDK